MVTVVLSADQLSSSSTAGAGSMPPSMLSGTAARAKVMTEEKDLLGQLADDWEQVVEFLKGTG